MTAEAVDDWRESPMPDNRKVDESLQAWGIWLRGVDTGYRGYSAVTPVDDTDEGTTPKLEHEVLTQDIIETAERVERLITLLPSYYQRVLIARYYHQWPHAVAGDRLPDFLGWRKKQKTLGRRNFERMLYSAQGAIAALVAVYG